MILKVFCNLNDSVLLWSSYMPCKLIGYFDNHSIIWGRELYTLQFVLGLLGIQIPNPILHLGPKVPACTSSARLREGQRTDDTKRLHINNSCLSNSTKPWKARCMPCDTDTIGWHRGSQDTLPQTLTPISGHFLELTLFLRFADDEMAFAVHDPKQIRRDSSPKTSGDKRLLAAEQWNGRICPVKHTKVIDDLLAHTTAPRSASQHLCSLPRAYTATTSDKDSFPSRNTFKSTEKGFWRAKTTCNANLTSNQVHDQTCFLVKTWWDSTTIKLCTIKLSS